MSQKTYKQTRHTYGVTRVGPLNANARTNPGFLEKCAAVCNYISGKGNEERDYEENVRETYNLPTGITFGPAGQEALRNSGIRYQSRPKPQQSRGDVEDRTLRPGLENFPGNPDELTILSPEGNLSATHLREIRRKKEQLAGK